MRILSPAERARQANPEPLDGHDGQLLALVAALCRELQHDVGENQSFRCPVRFVQNFLRLGQLSHASGLLRELERRGMLRCVQRGTRTTPDERGQPSLYRCSGGETY
jgi:hypothetical protein